VPGYVATFKSRGRKNMDFYYVADDIDVAKKEAKSFFAVAGLRLVAGSEIRIRKLEEGQSLELSRRS
jgi:hypothetical protein